MSEAVASRALDPFFTTKEVNSGTGLGLSMVYGFIQQSGGELRIYTEEGEGTTVKLFLPRGDDQDGLEGPVPREPVTTGNGETILIIEDEGVLLDQLDEFLKELGYKTIQAASGRAAIDMIEAGTQADLILTDIVMPGGVGGFELARLARATLPNVPVIYMSGYTGFTEEEMGDVVAPLLPKPSSPSAISAKIKEVLSGTAKPAERGA
jgi:CheY-like chemotaxis protein